MLFFAGSETVEYKLVKLEAVMASVLWFIHRAKTFKEMGVNTSVYVRPTGGSPM